MLAQLAIILLTVWVLVELLRHLGQPPGAARRRARQILITAIASKFAAGVAGARWAGQAWRPAFMVGALFATALITTLMTSPLLTRLSRKPGEVQSLAAGAKP